MAIDEVYINTLLLGIVCCPTVCLITLVARKGTLFLVDQTNGYVL